LVAASNLTKKAGQGNLSGFFVSLTKPASENSLPNMKTICLVLPLLLPLTAREEKRLKVDLAAGLAIPKS
jgi:hypothetical protein